MNNVGAIIILLGASGAVAFLLGVAFAVNYLTR